MDSGWMLSLCTIGWLSLCFTAVQPLEKVWNQNLSKGFDAEAVNAIEKKQLYLICNHYTLTGLENGYREGMPEIRFEVAPDELVYPLKLGRIMLPDVDPCTGRGYSFRVVKPRLKLRAHCEGRVTSCDGVVDIHHDGTVSLFRRPFACETLVNVMAECVLNTGEKETISSHAPSSIYGRGPDTDVSSGRYCLAAVVFITLQPCELYEEKKRIRKNLPSSLILSATVTGKIASSYYPNDLISVRVSSLQSLTLNTTTILVVVGRSDKLLLISLTIDDAYESVTEVAKNASTFSVTFRTGRSTDLAFYFDLTSKVSMEVLPEDRLGWSFDVFSITTYRTNVCSSFTSSPSLKVSSTVPRIQKYFGEVIPYKSTSNFTIEMVLPTSVGLLEWETSSDADGTSFVNISAPSLLEHSNITFDSYTWSYKWKNGKVVRNINTINKIQARNSENNMKITVFFGISDGEMMKNGSTDQLSLLVFFNKLCIRNKTFSFIIIKTEPVIEATISVDTEILALPNTSIPIHVTLKHVEGSSTDDTVQIAVALLSRRISVACFPPSPATCSQVNSSPLITVDALPLGTALEFQVQAMVLDFEPGTNILVDASLSYAGKTSGAKKRSVIPSALSIRTNFTSFRVSPAFISNITPRSSFDFSVFIFPLRMVFDVDIVITLPTSRNKTLLLLDGASVEGLSQGEGYNRLHVTTTELDRDRLPRTLIVSMIDINASPGHNLASGNVTVRVRMTLLDHEALRPPTCIIPVLVKAVVFPNVIWTDSISLEVNLGPRYRPEINVTVEGLSEMITGMTSQWNILIQHTSLSQQYLLGEVFFQLILSKFLTVVNTTLESRSSAEILPGYRSDRFYMRVNLNFSTVGIRLRVSVRANDPAGSQSEVIPSDVYVVLEYGLRNGSIASGAWRFPVSIRMIPLPVLASIPEGIYERTVFLANDGTLYVCKYDRDRDAQCFSTREGSDWIAIDRRVGAVLGEGTKGDLYAIARTGRSYMVSRGGPGKSGWSFIPQDAFGKAKRQLIKDSSLVKLPCRTSSTLNISSNWTVSDQGILYISNGKGVPQLVLSWEC